MVQTIIKSKPKIKGKANIAFVLDVTESMTPCLENLKHNLVELAAKINEICINEFGIEKPELTFNAMGFRDLEEDEDWQIVIRDKDFTPNLDDIKEFFKKEEMKAAGGGSLEESALDGIYRAIKEMNWDKPAKVLIVFTDAPTKPTLHPSTTNGVTLGKEDSMSTLKEKIFAERFRVVIFGPEKVAEFETIGSWDNCLYVGDEKIEETLKNFKDEGLFKEKVISLIAKTTSASIHYSKGL